MIEPAVIIPSHIAPVSTCYTCGKQNAIELYDSNGKPMNYQLMLNMNNFKSVNNSSGYMSYFRCRHCGQRFSILWNGDVPEPLPTQTRYNNFIRKFITEES